jgi:hypothetical protein
MERIALGSCTLLLAACGTVGHYDPPGSPPLSPRVDQVWRWMSGAYSSAVQSKADPDFKNIDLHMQPMWRDRTDGRWLYVEQSMHEAADKPYRQRVYQLVDRDGGTVESLVYELPGDPMLFAGAWKSAAPLDQLTPEQLLPRSGCSVKLKAVATDRWSGGTFSQSCESSLRGAAYATSEVQLTATELDSWDRGFDKAGQQVWGSTKGPYRFKKQASGTQ